MHYFYIMGLVRSDSLVTCLHPNWSIAPMLLAYKKLLWIINTTCTSETMFINAWARSSHWWQLSMAVGSIDFLPVNDKTMHPPGTISSERDLRNSEKSFWNCSMYESKTLCGLILDMYILPLFMAVLALLSSPGGTCT